MTEYTGDLWLQDMEYLQPLVPEFTDDQAEKFHGRVNLSVSVGATIETGPFLWGLIYA